MKKFVLLVLTGILFASPVSSQSLKLVWETKRIFNVPESVLYRPETGLIYVSNIDGKPSVKDGNGFISLLNKNGQIVKLHWATGLNAPKGMTIKGNYLFVSDIDRLAEIDLNNGKIIRFIDFSGAKFLNDVVVGPNGKIYVTDTELGAVFVVKAGKPHLWSNNRLLKGANGLATEQDKLLIGANGHLLKGDLQTGELQIITKVPHGIDGLIPLGNGKYVVSDWAGEIRLIVPGKPQLVLSNTTMQNINAADLGSIPGEKIILIPTFFDNRVVAKQLVDF